MDFTTAQPSFASSPNKHKEMPSPDALLISLVTQLSDPDCRAASVARLAQHLGGKMLIVFIRDPEFGTLLPAPGFPQTLPGGRAWRAFLKSCSEAGKYQAELPYPNLNSLCKATGIAAADGSVLVLLGGEPYRARIGQVQLLLPLLAGVLRGEQTALIAEGQSMLARQAALQAQTLTETLDAARRDLQKAIQLRDQFLSIAAHELRTPLTALLGYLQVLQRRVAKEPDFNPRNLDTISAVTAQARRLNKLTGSLFDLARIQTGILNIEHRPVDLSRLVRQMVDEMRPTLEKHTAVLEELQDEVIIEGDEMRLEQALQNLLDNAVKYSPEGGDITIRLVSDEQFAHISVSDEGMGIPQDAIPKLFDRFYRASNINPRNISGMGIGLYLVNDIVVQHKGSIQVSSSETEKTTFTIHLPISPNTTKPLGDYPIAQAQERSEA